MKKLFINGRWVYWVAGAGLITIGVVVVYNRKRTAKIYDDIKAKLASTDASLESGPSGNFKDLDTWAPLANPAKFIQNYKGPAPTISVGTAQNPGKARILAKQIADKVSKLDALTDQDGIVDVFRNLKLAVDVAKLADAYRMMYGGNLGTSLKGWLNPTVGKNRLPDLYEVLKRLE